MWNASAASRPHRPPGVPQSKPIWLTEIGVPAVDKGTERAERLSRSEIVGIRLSAVLARHARRSHRRRAASRRSCPVSIPRCRGFSAGAQPGLVPSTARRMVDPRPRVRLGLGRAAVSGLSGFRLGLGRRRQLGDRPLDHRPDRGRGPRPADRRDPAGFRPRVPAAIPVDGFLDGYVVDRPMSARGALEPLARLFGIDAVGARRRARAGAGAAAGPSIALCRRRSRRLGRRRARAAPRARRRKPNCRSRSSSASPMARSDTAAPPSHRAALPGSSRREARADAAIVTRRAEAQRLADAWLQDSVGRRARRAEFELCPAPDRHRAGRRDRAADRGGPRLHRIVRIADGSDAQGSTTRAVEPTVFEPPGAASGRSGAAAAAVCRQAAGDRARPAGCPRRARPVCNTSRWRPIPGRAPSRSGAPANGASFALDRIVDLPADRRAHARTAARRAALALGHDDALLDVAISRGTLASVDDEAALAGANLFAVRGADGRWEIFCAGPRGPDRGAAGASRASCAGSPAARPRPAHAFRPARDRAPRRGGRAAHRRASDLGAALALPHRAGRARPRRPGPIRDRGDGRAATR